MTFILFFWFAAGYLRGQTYRAAQIIHQSDSLLRAFAGDSLYQNFIRNTVIDYDYIGKDGKIRSSTITDTHALTKGKFLDSYSNYRFTLSYSKCPDMDTIKGNTVIRLDDRLHSRGLPDMGFIPDMVVNNQPCNFITKDEAIQIAKQQNLKVGIHPLSVYLYHNPIQNEFTWEVTNILTERNGSGECEMVSIDPVTGKVRAHWDSVYDTVTR